MGFFESIWHSKGIGDGENLEEALQAYLVAKPDDGDWVGACSVDGADPHIDRYSSFDDYLNNADPHESIPVTSTMIIEALRLLPP